MKVKKVMAFTLVSAMLMGQTVWAQEAITEPETQNSGETQENSWHEDSEQELRQADDVADVIVEEETNSGELAGESTEEDVVIEKEVSEESVYIGADTGIDTEEKIICVNYPIMVDARYSYSGDLVYSVESADESICEVMGDTYDIGDNINGTCFTLYGISTGETMIYLKLGDRIIKQYDVIVNELPEDAVMFNDIALRTAVLSGFNNDKNGDNCINKSEMEYITSLVLNARGMYESNSIKDLKGLEYATNLEYLYLDGNSELSDISVLFEMESLKTVNLTGTNVSDADRWKLANFEDGSMVKGEKILLPALGNLFDEGLIVEIVSGEECVEITNSENVYNLVAKEGGEVKLKISYNNYSTEITITIQGISAEQEVGEDYDIGITAVNNSVTNTAFPDKSLILDSNNQLWQTYPTGEKIRDNVKEYVATWIYYGDDNSSEDYAYILDMNNVLWNGATKLAEDVEKFDGRYVLDNNDVLKNIYNSGSEEIEQVEDWISPQYGSSGIAYLLKKDGTLWKRQEVEANQVLSEWEQIDSNVRQILREIYLKEDGTVVKFDGTVLNIDVKVSKICSDGTYYDSEGNYYCAYYYNGWNSETETFEYCSGYANVGKLDVKKQYAVNNATYLLTQDNMVYKYDAKNSTMICLLSDVIQVNGLGIYSLEGSNIWTFQLSDGTYCDLNGKPMSEVVIMDWDEYKLIMHEDGTKIVERNGVTILNCIIDVWSDYQDEMIVYFALRTDGTVWNITGIPEKILDLKQSSNSKGDLNRDGETNLLDLMQCLNHVSKKNLLEGTTYTIADINEDGLVDLLDLMRILNYVSKKTSEL